MVVVSICFYWWWERGISDWCWLRIFGTGWLEFSVLWEVCHVCYRGRGEGFLVVTMVQGVVVAVGCGSDDCGRGGVKVGVVGG